MCWVTTGAESVYNLSPTGFEIYLYQTDGEARDKQTAHTFWDDLDIFTLFIARKRIESREYPELEL